MKNPLLLCLSLFVTAPLSAFAGDANDITCTIDLGTQSVKVGKLLNSYTKKLAESKGYSVSNLSTDIEEDSVSFVIFGPNSFQLNVDLPVSTNKQIARTTLSGIRDLGTINIECSRP